MWDSDKLQNAQSKRTKDKGKNVFIKHEKKYIMYTDRLSLPKKNYKGNCKKILVVKPWHLEEGELPSSSAGW